MKYLKILSKNKKLQNARGRVAAQRDHFGCPRSISTKIKNYSHIMSIPPYLICTCFTVM